VFSSRFRTTVKWWVLTTTTKPRLLLQHVSLKRRSTSIWEHGSTSHTRRRQNLKSHKSLYVLYRLLQEVFRVQVKFEVYTRHSHLKSMPTI
jgi:hypothetical protein